jgi:predicted ribosomally synthesized peptide with nif11-like leader
MSEQQLTALLAKIKDDAGLREKLQGAANLDAAISLAKEAGFDVSKAELEDSRYKQLIFSMWDFIHHTGPDFMHNLYLDDPY